MENIFNNNCGISWKRIRNTIFNIEKTIFKITPNIRNKTEKIVF